MSKDLTIADAAKLLKVEEQVVTRMFDEGKLSGFRWGTSWRTTEEMLARDIEILMDEARVASMDNEGHRTRWDLTAEERMNLAKDVSNPRT